LQESDTLRRAAREIFERVLASVDARRAVLDAVGLRGPRLRVCAEEFDLDASAGGLYCVALGKAARAMASALEERLGERLAGGVISGPPHGPRLSGRWRAFAGGHPLPNEASLEAARAAFELLGEANERRAVVLFLVSGGGSAMLEWPRDPSVTLEDLREANRVLVSCGASIAEVNAVRRALSSVKGGGLAARAPLATQVTLIVSDTSAGREADVASGPTLPAACEPPYTNVVEKYDLARALPPRVVGTLEGPDAAPAPRPEAPGGRSFVLLDNARACEAAAEAARALGFVTELAADLSEQPVEAGAAESVARLSALRGREGGRGVCLVSGGEFACPVRGPGVGGRNSETALRCAFEFEKGGDASLSAVALCAGTDGFDGNSPAAGALADHTTLARARALGLRPEQHLDDSDAYTLFKALGDALVTGPTGTNVRDLRILLASRS
jgi:glycerate 2-kinase